MRDYFAAKAMPAILSLSAHVEMEEGVAAKALAAMSYRIADAMLKAREK